MSCCEQFSKSRNQSRPRFSSYRVSGSNFAKTFKSRSRIFKQGSRHLGESRILPFATPKWKSVGHWVSKGELVSFRFFMVSKGYVNMLKKNASARKTSLHHSALIKVLCSSTKLERNFRGAYIYPTNYGIYRHIVRECEDSGAHRI